MKKTLLAASALLTLVSFAAFAQDASVTTMAPGTTPVTTTTITPGSVTTTTTPSNADGSVVPAPSVTTTTTTVPTSIPGQ